MIHLIMGLKGSGKTKKLLDSINDAVATSKGSVVCIEYGANLTYGLSHKVRLVNSKEYGISNADMLKGFVSGLHAGNYDITHVYVDNLYKTIGDDQAAAETFILWAAAFAEANSMEITISVSQDPEKVSDAVKAFL